MFPDGYFAPSYWAPRYWGRYSGGAPPVWTPSVGQGTTQDFFQIMRSVFDQTQGALRASSPGAASGSSGGSIDAKRILKEVYDPDTNTLRVVEV